MKKILFFFSIILLISSCKDSYFSDGGILPEHVSQFDGTTLEYLSSLPQQFDTLTQLIKINKLEEVVNAKGSTFFAPQDYSIQNYFKIKFPDPTKKPKSLEEIPTEVHQEISEIIKNYVIPDAKITRPNLSTVYTFKETIMKKIARFNLIREDYLGNINMGPSYIMFSVNINPEGTTPQYQAAKVVVSDMETRNGIVQTLVSDTHVFGFK